jgi:hypothetical protein
MEASHLPQIVIELAVPLCDYLVSRSLDDECWEFNFVEKHDYIPEMVSTVQQ